MLIASKGYEINDDFQDTDSINTFTVIVRYMLFHYRLNLSAKSKPSERQGSGIDMEFVVAGAQIVLMDGNILRKYINTGILAPVDNYVKKLNLDLNKYPVINTKTELTEKLHIYAIPMEYYPFY